jgi:uncharacterized membrane protein
MNLFDWILVGIVAVVLVAWGILAMIAKGMSDKP